MEYLPPQAGRYAGCFPGRFEAGSKILKENMNGKK